jgi:hypothetical protein
MMLQWQGYWQNHAEDAGEFKFMDGFYMRIYTG